MKSATREYRRYVRIARLLLLGLLGGAVAGIAAAGDIESSFGKRRIAAAATAPAAQTASGAPEQGYELAARLRFTSRGDCRTLHPALRIGCADYVARAGAGAAGTLDLPL